MSYTVLRIVEQGVLLFDAHERRFARVGSAAVRAFRSFSSDAEPGVYSLTWRDGQLESQLRMTTSLFEGIPVRYLPSPYAGTVGPIHKQPLPNPYQAARLPGTATLLTSSDGSELYESCAASVVSWDGARFVTVPEDRPKLLSTAVAALVASGMTTPAPVLRESSGPLALVNAVSGLVAPLLPGRVGFPREARELASALFHATARRA